MSKSKKVIVVVLTVLFVISSVASFLSLALRFGVASPEVYEDFMPKVNAYSSFYPGLKDLILGQTQYMELPEEIAMVPEEIFDEAIPEDYFNEKIGSFVGGTIGWIFFNQGEAEVPINDIQDRLQTAIENNKTVANDTGNLAEIMNLALLTPLKSFELPGDNPSTLRQYIYHYLTGGSEEVKARYDFYFDVLFYYYGNLLNWVSIGSVALSVLLFIILILINKDNRDKTFKTAKIVLLVSGILNAIAALLLWLGKPIFDSITETYAEYIKMMHPILDGLAIVYAGYAAILLILFLAAHCIQKYIEKTAQINDTQAKAA